jgi:hypothetical protein
MEKIRELGNLAGATIIEHRDGGEKPVVGRIDDFTVQGGG